MGARNSTPKTVRIENPQRDLAVQVTPSVVSRLVGGEDLAQKKIECSKCEEKKQEKRQERADNWTQAQDLFQRKYNDLEEAQFDKSVEKVKTMIGKPLAWEEDVNETITNLRYDLIKCYKDHPKQSLCCADIAKQYQNFIFREQYKVIRKFNEQNIINDLSSNSPHSNTN